ncbi:OmpA family protein [Maribacter sp. 2307ULW6-5]|uniref:OmpA family protein n=1 Tax=Maribacter sp. 2307ULW6-5 TaxID=3386275 RepID=UPI0039BCD9A5
MLRTVFFFFIGIMGPGPAFLAQGQNLVQNPSFEQYVSCPDSMGNLVEDVAHWQTPSLGSTDYYHSCSTTMGTDGNFSGSQAPGFGSGYAGLYFYAGDEYREYLMGELTTTLVAGERYRLAFYVSLAERSGYAVDAFGARLLEKPVLVETRKVLSKKHLLAQEGDASPVMVLSNGDFYVNTTDWVRVATEFVAKGTENYIIIGNFNANRRTKKRIQVANGLKGAYYYLDAISLMPLEGRPPQKEAEVGAAFETNRSIVFENVRFRFDTATLEPGAISEIERVYGYLREHPTLHIAIEGHTDQLGSTTYNQKLSEGRAAAVAAHLIALGLEKDRVSWKGYGSTRPLAVGKGAAARQMNRRVAFVILE